jgi:hypothetical protein
MRRKERRVSLSSFEEEREEDGRVGELLLEMEEQRADEEQEK